MKKISFLILAVFVMVTCMSNVKSNSTREKTLEKNIQDIPIGYNNLFLRGEIVKKENFEDGDNSDCSDWILDREQLKNILQSMEKVDATEWYAACQNYPCWYEGVLLNKTSEYEIIINAASYIIISNEKETLHFVLDKKSKLFLIPCYTEG